MKIEIHDLNTSAVKFIDTDDSKAMQSIDGTEKHAIRLAEEFNDVITIGHTLAMPVGRFDKHFLV